MPIRILHPGDQARLEEFLLPRIETSMFLLGNSRRCGLIDGDALFHGTYAASFEGGRITGVAGHFWQHHFIVQAPPAQVAGLVRAALAASRRSFRGILGTEAQVAAAISELGLAWTGGQLQIDERDCLYRLELDQLAVPESVASGCLATRRAAPDDLDLLARWRAEYLVEALGFDETAYVRGKCRNDVEALIEEGRLWVAAGGDGAVACSAFNSRIAEAVQIGGVYTPPAFRGRGYARASVAGSLLAARDEGVPLAVLFTPKQNTPARRAYESIGFEVCGDYRVLLFREGIGIKDPIRGRATDANSSSSLKNPS